MTIFQFTVLFLVFIVLVLIAAHFFHRYERAIFWSVALFLFIGVLVLLGTGVLKIIKDGHANSGALFVAFMCLITAGVLVIATQEPESFIRKRRKAISKNSSSDAPQEQESVVLTRKLDTPLAKEVFAKAINEGLMEVNGSHYKWSGQRFCWLICVAEFTVMTVRCRIVEKKVSSYGIQGTTPLSLILT